MKIEVASIRSGIVSSQENAMSRVFGRADDSFRLNNIRRPKLIRFVLLVWVLIIALTFTSTTYAQDKISEIDSIFSWTGPSTPGCTCAVSQNGKLIVNRAYGSADIERNVPISPNSVFDAGSLTKQFVAAAILLLVEDKRLSLSDDVHKYVPELPDYGHTITIDHLLTHTSGIRDWTGIAPFAAVETSALNIVLRQRGLNFLPGEEWSYSNSGYVLLKEIVNRASGMSFSEFASKRLFEPLGMKLTSYRDDLRAVIKNRALAYNKEAGNWKMAMLFDNDRGGGGALLSTAGDLIIWNEALTNRKLGAFVSEKLQEQTKLNNGRKLDYGRGLFLDSYRGTKEIWHTGSADGYKSWLGRYPEYDLSIAIMCNSGDGTNRTMFAHRIFDLFVPATGEQKAKASFPAVEGLDLRTRAGLYFSELTGQPMRLVVDGTGFRIAGGPALIPITKDRFRRLGASVEYMSQDEFELQFLSEDEFELKSMEGNTTHYRRARPYTLTSADLKKLEGRYKSDEIGTIFQVTSVEDGIIIRLEHSPDKSLELKPVDPDTFQRGMMMVRFRRDKNGKVVGIDYNNPLIRSVRFSRLKD